VGLGKTKILGESRDEEAETSGTMEAGHKDHDFFQSLACEDFGWQCQAGVGLSCPSTLLPLPFLLFQAFISSTSCIFPEGLCVDNL
jgi:hypothetical protein